MYLTAAVRPCSILFFFFFSSLLPSLDTVYRWLVWHCHVDQAGFNRLSACLWLPSTGIRGCLVPVLSFVSLCSSLMSHDAEYHFICSAASLFCIYLLTLCPLPTSPRREKEAHEPGSLLAHVRQAFHH